MGENDAVQRRRPVRVAVGASAGSGESGAGSGGGEHVKARRRRDWDYRASAMAWMDGQLTPLMARGAWQMDEVYVEVVFTAPVWVVRVRSMDAAAAPGGGEELSPQ